MKYCSYCGEEILFFIFEGDNWFCYWCNYCGVIYYQNLKIVVGVILVWEGCFLFCKCFIELCIGYWILFVGYMENGEILQEGVVCEIWEEVCVIVVIGDLYMVFNLLYINQVYMFFLSEMVNGDYGVGDESVDVGLFFEDEIFWDELVFFIIGCMLKFFIQDCVNGGEFLVCIQDIFLFKCKFLLDD